MTTTGSILGTEFDCSCGRRHKIAPSQALYRDDAIEQMGQLCQQHAGPGRRAAVLMDARTAAAAGDAVIEAMSRRGWQCQKVELADAPDGGSPVCDDSTRRWLDGLVKPDATDTIVSVGSGVVSDLGKWLAFDLDKPFIVFATAASMNGYASANVAPTINGVKTLLRARAPLAVASSPQVLGQAPHEMTAAGLGDVLAKSVSSADWYMNHHLFGDYFCQRATELIAELEPLYLLNPAALQAGDDEAMAALFQALLLTGVAMNMAETSAPASGGEHMVSHTLDMQAAIGGGKHDLHGRQVGVGAILTAALYEEVLSLDEPRIVSAAAGIDRNYWLGLSRNLADENDAKAARLKQAAEMLAWPGSFRAMRPLLAPFLRTPGTIREALAAAGAACTAADIGIDKETLLNAFVHAHEARSRFTILDLARLVGVMPAAAADIVERWS